MNLSKERSKVRKRYPGAYAYQWAARDWVIYAAKDGALQGIALTGQCSSMAHAWISAAFKVKFPRKRRVDSGKASP